VSAHAAPREAAGEGADPLSVVARVPGRIVLAERDGTLHLGRSYDVHRSRDDGRTWEPVTSMPRNLLRRMADRSRLACRLLRMEVRALARRADGGYVAANREGVFVAAPGERRMRPSRIETGGLPLLPPMRISRGPAGQLVWGEYGSPRVRRPMRLFASRDGGESFQVVRTFDKGEILHVHNVIWDPGQRHFWVLAGDFDPEPGIGCLSEDLQRFEWFVKGEQRYRAVEVFDLGDRLLYATDTHLEQNRLVSLDKRTGHAETLREFDGSCIYACRFGGILALTTTVEPSAVNRSPWSGLWLSRDGERWHRAWQGRKDRWHPDWFQFGSLMLPTGETDRETIVFSGQALAGLDGWTVVARPAPDGPLAG